jgi:tetratricopeptide (TPR) repeat protein
MLLFKVWFRVAFFVIVGFGVFLAFYLPKMWRTSPDGFNPVIRVSGLDLTQGWALKRNARKADAQGDVKQAYFSWLAAVGQNASDKEALRGFLNNFTRLDSLNARQVEAALGQSIWLLRIGNTNQVDVDLVTRLCDTFNWSDVCLYFFDPIADQLKGEVEARYLRALFYQGRMQEFTRRLAEWKAAGNKDEVMATYELAGEAGWGTGKEALDSLQQLEKIAADGPVEKRVLPMRLLMMVNGERHRVQEYKQCLDMLANQNEANTLDHIQYWKLLAGSGRKDEAVALAERYSNSPVSGYELLRLAEVYSNLGLTEQSHVVLQKFAPRYGQSPEVWAAYASVLEDLKDWQEMRGIALQIREQRANREGLWGYSYFLEGRAELAQERITTAEIAFRKAGEANYPIPALGFMIAKRISDLNYPGYARPIFDKVENAMAEREDFWAGYFDCAYQLKDGPGVLKAAERDYRLKPTDLTKLNRFAAALLANRVRPEEAVQLTLQLVNARPKNPTALINHAFALLLNNRVDEASSIVEKCRKVQLNPFEESALHMALFDLAFRSKDFETARRESDLINRQSLFPAQVNWLEACLKELPPRVTGKF